MGVTIKPTSIPKLREAIRHAQNARLNRTGETLAAGPIEDSFFAYITGMTFETVAHPSASTPLNVYSFVRVQPCNEAEADMLVGGTNGYRLHEPPVNHLHAAIEINNQPTPVNVVVRMTFTGYREIDGMQKAMYAFSYTPTIIRSHLQIHDHRSNAPEHGGFAFAVYAPGTSLPQRPWGI